MTSAPGSAERPLQAPMRSPNSSSVRVPPALRGWRGVISGTGRCVVVGWSPGVYLFTGADGPGLGEEPGGRSSWRPASCPASASTPKTNPAEEAIRLPEEETAEARTQTKTAVLSSVFACALCPRRSHRRSGRRGLLEDAGPRVRVRPRPSEAPARAPAAAAPWAGVSPIPWEGTRTRLSDLDMRLSAPVRRRWVLCPPWCLVPGVADHLGRGHVPSAVPKPPSVSTSRRPAQPSPAPGPLSGTLHQGVNLCLQSIKSKTAACGRGLISFP